MKKGDHVRYVGGMRQGWYGETAVITDINNAGVSVKWDRSGLTMTNDGKGIRPESLELIMPTIDHTKPLLIFAATGCQPAQPVPLIARTDEGHVIVETGHTGLGSDFRWLVFTEEGKPVRSNQGPIGLAGHGGALRLKNAPVIEHAFIRVSGTVRHHAETSLHKCDPQGDAVASIKLTIEDGVVTGAELVRANTPDWPIKVAQL